LHIITIWEALFS